MDAKVTLCPKVLSIHVGRPRCFNAEDDFDKPWMSAIVKDKVDGPVHVGQTNLAGDGQADLQHHGGVDKAVLAYSADHYQLWLREFPNVAWTPGSFGENLCLAGASESDVCIGDVFQFGASVLQITQPRQPCWKLSRRWRLPKLAVRVQRTRRTGWYFRVLREGIAEAPCSMNLIERPHPEWSVAGANEVMFAKPRNSRLDLALAECQALSASWKATLSQRGTRSKSHLLASEQKRLDGRDDK